MFVLNPPDDRPIACSPSFFAPALCWGGAHNRRIDYCVLIIGILCQSFKDLLPTTRAASSSMTPVNSFKVTKPLRQVPPRNTGAIPI